MDRFASRFEHDHLVVKNAQGAWLQDKQERMWLDYLLGNCTQTLGHCHPRIVEAIHSQANMAINVGDHIIEKTEILANMICQISKKDQLRFVNSGSEACHLAIRLARAVTDRKLIVKFNGHYHGWFGEEVAKFTPAFPYQAGLHSASQIISLPWNDFDMAKSIFEKQGDKIAAVICEPILCHAGVVPPLPGFLEQLRNDTRTHGALLIFDECITGFRVALGGAQEYTGVYSDLVIYSKALSQGVPFSVCAGTKEAMEPLSSGKAYQGASYDAHPIGVAVALETLKIFKEENTHLKLQITGEKYQMVLGSIFRDMGFDVCIQGIPGAFQFFFTDLKQMTSYEEVFEKSEIALNKRLIELLRNFQIQLGRGDIQTKQGAGWMGQWFYSTAHGDKELEYTATVLRKALLIMGVKCTAH